MKKKLEVIAGCRVVGFHRWEGAAGRFEYLASRHRHEFVITCCKPVGGADREIEVNDLKEDVEQYLIDAYGWPCEFGGMSCEQIALELCEKFELSECRVLEDGLCGAVAR